MIHPWRVATIALVGIAVGSAAFYLYELNTALGAVAVEEFHPEAAREAIEALPERATPTTAYDIEIVELPEGVHSDPLDEIEATYGQQVSPQQRFPNAFGERIDDDVFESYLLIGSDASGFLADTIILALQPNDGSGPIMVSLPRDLLVWNLCKGRFGKLNEGLGGCAGSASGSELMAIMVEDYTGIPVDHLARINFDGFSNLVDVMGGITVCVDYPTRDTKSHLDMPEPGCRRANGDMALAWVRSRHMEQLRGEEWVLVGGSDFGRQSRQQDALFQLAGRAAAFSSPTTLADRLSAVAKSVRLDSSWSFSQAVAAGWRYRGISKSSVKRFSIEVANGRNSLGQAVLLPTTTFTERLAEVYSLG